MPSPLLARLCAVVIGGALVVFVSIPWMLLARHHSPRREPGLAAPSSSSVPDAWRVDLFPWE